MSVFVVVVVAHFLLPRSHDPLTSQHCPCSFRVIASVDIWALRLVIEFDSLP
jgi:hypothetical protein